MSLKWLKILCRPFGLIATVVLTLSSMLAVPASAQSAAADAGLAEVSVSRRTFRRHRQRSLAYMRATNRPHGRVLGRPRSGRRESYTTDAADRNIHCHSQQPTFFVCSKRRWQLCMLEWVLNGALKPQLLVTIIPHNKGEEK